MNRNTLYLYEGECEENLIKSLKQGKIIAHGSMRKFNLWEKPIERIVRTIAKGSVVIVVFDTDVSGQMDLFVSNVRKLAKSAQRVILLPQHPDYEGELVYACRIGNKPLCDVLYNVSSSKLKKKLRNDKALVETLNRKGFDIRRMWCRKTCRESMKACEKSNVEWGAGRILKR